MMLKNVENKIGHQIPKLANPKKTHKPAIFSRLKIKVDLNSLSRRRCRWCLHCYVKVLIRIWIWEVSILIDWRCLTKISLHLVTEIFPNGRWSKKFIGSSYMQAVIITEILKFSLNDRGLRFREIKTFRETKIAWDMEKIENFVTESWERSWEWKLESAWQFNFINPEE